MSNLSLVKSNQNIKVQYVDVNHLKPSDYNPRYWEEKAIRDLTKSIKENGFIIPILVNCNKTRYGIVIAGHFRLKIAIDLGYKTVPVNFMDISDIEKEKKLNLTLNRVSGDWDYELLKNFDIEMLLESGFDDSDLSHIWDENLGIEDDEFDVEKALQEIKTSKTKTGDLVKLGNNFLFCGDATNPNDVKKLVGKEKIDMVYSDSPYNISLDYNKGIGGKANYGGTTNDKKPEGEYKTFLKKTLENALAVSKPDCHIFYYCDESYIWLVQTLYQELGIDNKRVCLWIKNGHNPTPQVAFNKAYEPVVYGTRGSPYLAKNVTTLNEVLNREIGTGNRLPDDILDQFNIWLVKRLPGQDYIHPTQKPASLHEKPLRRCSKPGDAVLDLFAGSGSTMVACEQLKRRAFLCEIEPIFCDVIIKRYKELTGKEAEYVS